MEGHATGCQEIMYWDLGGSSGEEGGGMCQQSGTKPGGTGVKRMWTEILY